MTQPSLFDPIIHQKQTEEQLTELDKEIALLAERIKKADAWLDLPASKSDPRYPKARDAYFEMMSQHVDLVVKKENLENHWHCCVMELPPGVTWGKGEHKIVKVFWDSEPVSDDEMTYAQLGELISDVNMVKEVMSEG